MADLGAIGKEWGATFDHAVGLWTADGRVNGPHVISGTLVGAEDQPLIHRIGVLRYGVPFAIHRVAFPRADGSVEFRGLLPGQYDVIAWGNGVYRTRAFGPIQVA